MEPKEILKTEVQKEFKCNSCEYVKSCKYSEGKKGSECFDCFAFLFEKGFKSGLKVSFIDCLNKINSDPLLLHTCLSSLSRYCAKKNVEVGAAFMSISERVEINSKKYKTSIIVTTSEDNDDSVSDFADKFAFAVIEENFNDIPDKIKKKLCCAISAAFITGYNEIILR